MAQAKVRLSLTSTDGQGHKASMTAYSSLVDTTTLADALIALAALQSAVDAVTDTHILEGKVSIVATYSPTSKATFASSDNITTLVTDYGNGADNSTWGFAVPGRADALITGGAFNKADSNLVALETLIKSGNGFTNNAYVDLTSFRNAFLTGRKHRLPRGK